MVIVLSGSFFIISYALLNASRTNTSKNMLVIPQKTIIQVKIVIHAVVQQCTGH